MIQKAKARYNKRIDILISIIWLVFCFTQMVNYNIDKYLCHAVWFLWLLSLLVFKNTIITSTIKKKRYFLLFAFIIYYLFSSFLSVGISVAFNRVIALLELTSPILMYDLLKSSDKNIKMFVMFAFFAILTIVTSELISTMNLYFGMGLREVVRNDEDLYLRNAFNWVYSWIFITTASVLSIRFCLKKGKRKWMMLLLSVFLFLLGVYVIVRSLFMTAIVMMLLGCVLSCFYGRKRWIVKAALAISGGFVAFVLTFNVIINQIGLMEEGADFLTQRTGEIYHTIVGGNGDTHDMEARGSLTSMSLSTFFANPLFGINHKISDFKQAQYSMVGDHSEWIDNLALYGLCFLFLFFFLVKSAKLGPSNTGIIYITYFLTGFLNPIWYFPQNVVVFFFIPIVFNLFDESQSISIVERYHYCTSPIKPS